MPLWFFLRYFLFSWMLDITSVGSICMHTLIRDTRPVTPCSRWCRSRSLAAVLERKSANLARVSWRRSLLCFSLETWLRYPPRGAARTLLPTRHEIWRSGDAHLVDPLYRRTWNGRQACHLKDFHYGGVFCTSGTGISRCRCSMTLEHGGVLSCSWFYSNAKGREKRKKCTLGGHAVGRPSEPCSWCTDYMMLQDL